MLSGVDLIQVVSIVGAIIILLAYSAGQAGWMRVEQPIYSVLNFVGSVVLFYVAIVNLQYGFILMEGVWAAISLSALLRRSGPRPERADPQA